MLQTRYDRISGLVDLYRNLEPTNINCLLINPIPITKQIQSIRESLKTEIESFSLTIIDGLLDVTGTLDVKFVEIVIDYNPHFVGQELAKGITKYYSAIGFNEFFKGITQIKNIIARFYCFEALYSEIIFDGENHRTEACDLIAKLKEMTSSPDFKELSEDQVGKVMNMIERLKPHARPIVKKNFYHVDLPMPKDAEKDGQSFPIFSRSGNWAEHHLVMSSLMNSFDEKKQQMKKVLKK